MYANEFKTKEKQKLTEIKINCNIHEEILGKILAPQQESNPQHSSN